MSVEGVEEKMGWLEDTVCTSVDNVSGKLPRSWDLRSIGDGYGYAIERNVHNKECGVDWKKQV